MKKILTGNNGRMYYCTLQKEGSRTILPLDKCQYFRPDCEDIVFVMVTFVLLHIQAISLYCSSRCKTLIQRPDRRLGGNSKLQLVGTLRGRVTKQVFRLEVLKIR